MDVRKSSAYKHVIIKDHSHQTTQPLATRRTGLTPTMGRSGYTCVRHIFCSLNVFMWLAGCGVLGVGVWLRLAYSGYAALLPQYSIISADSLCIAVGVIVFVIAFFGCCGSWFQSRCMLITYFSLVIFMFLFEFLIATLAFVFRENLGHVLREELKTGIELHYNATHPNSLDSIWTHIHEEFHCCGVSGYEDWYDISAWKGQRFVPDSCCDIKFSNTTDCGRSHNPDMWYTKGCAEQVQMWFVERLHIVGIVGLVVAFIQVQSLIGRVVVALQYSISLPMCKLESSAWHFHIPPPDGKPGSVDLAEGGQTVEPFFEMLLPNSCLLVRLTRQRRSQGIWTKLFGLISSMLLFCTVRHKRSSHTYKSYDPTT
uniref:Tetraspanin n=1 Tax=Timema poppense TaxID=170557 RepID=A0A7R9CGE0_TIMPO|nr:unnamed protein product [Timema poppensis]